MLIVLVATSNLNSSLSESVILLKVIIVVAGHSTVTLT